MRFNYPVNLKRLTTCLALCFGSSLHAGDLSLTLLYGDNYTVEPELQTTGTVEYVDRWSHGDLFVFVDYKHFPDSDADDTWYGEVSPRIKFYDGDMPAYAAFTWEKGKGKTEAYLGGLGTDFKIPGFIFAKANVYYRDAPNLDGHSWQTTVSWAYPFADGKLIVDGFADWVFSSEEGEPNLHFNPQIKWDMQRSFNTSLRWYLGLEYDYWSNKFGIDDALADSNQNTASLLIKAHF